MVDTTNQRKYYLYVLDTLADWEIGFITAELSSGRFLPGNTGVDLVRIGYTPDPVTTMGGMVITPDKAIEDIEFSEDDLLILPGAANWADKKNNRIIDIVSDVIDKEVIIAAICDATVALARKGLLNNRKHTSHDKEYLKMICPEYKGDQYFINSPAVADGNLITATGIAPLEFSYEVFKKINVMKEETLEAWYKLYKTQESKYFFSLMESLK